MKSLHVEPDQLNIVYDTQDIMVKTSKRTKEDRRSSPEDVQSQNDG